MVYLQILTRDQVLREFSEYKVMKFNKYLGAFKSVPVIPEVAFYEVYEGIQELELLD